MNVPILIASAVFSALCLGAIIGHALGTYRSDVPKLPMLDLSDSAIAHIAHEARRAYERSLGVINLKAWNNLEPNVRLLLTSRIARIRRGDRVIGSASNFAHRIELAVVGLAKKL